MGTGRFGEVVLVVIVRDPCGRTGRNRPGLAHPQCSYLAQRSKQVTPRTPKAQFCFVYVLEQPTALVFDVQVGIDEYDLNSLTLRLILWLMVYSEYTAAEEGTRSRNRTGRLFLYY